MIIKDEHLVVEDVCIRLGCIVLSNIIIMINCLSKNRLTDLVSFVKGWSEGV